MANTVRELADWSMYPFRLMGQTLDVLTKTTCDVSSAMTEAVRPEESSEASASGASSSGGYQASEPSSREGSQQSNSRSESGSNDQSSSDQNSGISWRGSSQSGSGSKSGGGDRQGGGSPDLSGDEIKLVRSYVVFTKPGNERISEAQTELVTWDTTNENYAGVIVGRYLRENADIDDYDMRYLKPHIEVIGRWPKESEEDDREANGTRRNEAGTDTERHRSRSEHRGHKRSEHESTHRDKVA